jgi:hypothetical protein
LLHPGADVFRNCELRWFDIGAIANSRDELRELDLGFSFGAANSKILNVALAGLRVTGTLRT